MLGLCVAGGKPAWELSVHLLVVGAARLCSSKLEGVFVCLAQEYGPCAGEMLDGGNGFM